MIAARVRPRQESGTSADAVPVSGACVHPVTSGTGAFAGAQGITSSGVYRNTRYDGNIILRDTAGLAAQPQAFSGPPAPSATAPLARVLSRPGCGST